MPGISPSPFGVTADATIAAISYSSWENAGNTELPTYSDDLSVIKFGGLALSPSGTRRCRLLVRPRFELERRTASRSFAGLVEHTCPSWGHSSLVKPDLAPLRRGFSLQAAGF
jgi:hypothetical protein